MKAFMDDNFLLLTNTAQDLYHNYAKQQPIFDYHCHLNPKDIAQNRQFGDLTEIWLEGDHYKWRALRTAGVEERLITGDASNYEKYLAWAKTVPLCIGNPLYHWTHLELRRLFGIKDRLLNEKSAVEIWHKCNEMLQQPEFSARGIMRQMKVKLSGTTDDPADSLQYHSILQQDDSFDIQVVPSWRPDNLFKIELAQFPQYIEKLGKAADMEINTFADL